ncbi:hypothetical protein BDZ90DRAFT_231190 [Jaminaea rosea]|uniref:Alpha/beta hydrolase fold-3 domain-containing protein n=1 Tax=Jaminaea rosea TaxID=1569628 RepID=A0A316UV76_9BASI|nr:hypothetical protein BDZ90DRAFT_231190 [Jaminaea rosea]PWN29207.1 hypothetical protein BDZ90DRAFT_231190 [Jaminaea rosea]
MPRSEAPPHSSIQGQDAELAAQDSTACQDSHSTASWSLGYLLSTTAPLVSPLSLIDSIPDLALAAWHLFVLLPIALGLAFGSHVILSRSNWIRGGGPQRLAWPISRCRGWSFRDTASVAVVGHLLAAFRHVSRTPFCPSAEKLIPILSHRAFGVKHQGWSLGGSQVQLDDLDAELSLQLPASTSHTPSTLQPPLAPILLWKAQASSVHHHQIQSVKPAVDVGGVGSGPASPSERVMLLLSGSSYSDRDPVAGMLACQLVNSTGLRTLCVNWRKASPCSAGKEGAFPAGLNDALAAYVHLVRTLRFEPRNVYLVGEGSGAGLAMSLLLWLSALARSPERSAANELGKPGKVVLWSPWCDLSMRSPTWKQNGAFDIHSPQAARRARDLYASSILQPGPQQQHASVEDDSAGGVSSSASSPVGPQTPASDGTVEPLLRVPSPLAMSEAKRTPPSFTTALNGAAEPSGLRRFAETSRASERQEASVGSDSGVEIDRQQRVGGATNSSSQSDGDVWASVASKLRRALDHSDGGEESDSSLSSSSSASSSDACHVLASSIPALGLAHPLLSPGIPIDDPTEGEGAQKLRRLVFSMLVADREGSSTAPTSYLLFCGTESVLRGEASSLARNLKSSSPASAPASVHLVEALETPTLLNVVPSVFLCAAQAKGDEVVQRFLVGDACST